MKNKKQLVVLGVISIIISCFMQILLCEVDYAQFIEDKQINATAIESTEGYNITDTYYEIQDEEGKIYLDEVSLTAQSILLEFSELTYNYIEVQVYYATEDHIFSESQSVSTKVLVNNSFAIISIPKNDYSYFRIDIEGSDFYLGNIYVMPEFNPYLLQVSKISCFNTMVIAIIVFFALCIAVKKNMYQKDYFPFIVVGVLTFLQISQTGLFADDATWLSIYQYYDGNFVRFTYEQAIKWQYFNWGSPVIVMIGSFLGTVYTDAWLILNTLFTVLTCYSISELIPRKSRQINWLIVGLYLIYPIQQIISAGWIMTTAVYLWPLAAGIYSLIPIKKIYFNEDISKFKISLYVISTIYACNSLQMCCVILGVHVLALIYFKYNHIKSKFVYVLTTLSVLSLTFHLTCPGNAIRSVEEEARHFPEFGFFSLFDKIELGLSSTLSEYIMNPNLIFTIFCVTLCLIVAKNTSNNNVRVLSTTPLIVSSVFGILSPLFVNSFPFIADMKSTMTEYGSGINILDIRSWCYDGILISVCLIVLISLFLAFKDIKLPMFLSLIILLGFGSRMVMSFSPTIWVSGERTFIFMYFSLIICTVYMYSNIIKFGSCKKVNVLNGLVLFLAVFSYINNTYLYFY